jgi:hypothetical protein
MDLQRLTDRALIDELIIVPDATEAILQCVLYELIISSEITQECEFSIKTAYTKAEMSKLVAALVYLSNLMETNIA